MSKQKAIMSATLTEEENTVDAATRLKGNSYDLMVCLVTGSIHLLRSVEGAARPALARIIMGAIEAYVEDGKLPPWM